MLHFDPEEFEAREARLRAAMEARGLDGLLLFSPESQYWLTGYDTFGFCHFQCLAVGPRGMALLTRSADRLQARLTSTIGDVRIWRDGHAWEGELVAMLSDLGLAGARLGWETATHGLTHAHGLRVAAAIGAAPAEASNLVSRLRLRKSAHEIEFVRRAAALADEALLAALPLIGPGAEEAEILAAMQGAVLGAGGDYPANEFIIGSGEHALLCRYQAGRRRLAERDQLTLEWAGAWRHYHAALMRTVLVGAPTDAHLRMAEAARKALLACENALRVGERMGEVYDAHAESLDQSGLGHARLNACGYALGARFAPSWMEAQMFHEGAEELIEENSVYFLHMILMDSESGAAMSLGRTSLTAESGPEPLSGLDLEVIAR